MRTCSVCNIAKDDADYRVDRHRRDGLSSKCRQCARAKAKARYDADPDTPRKASRDYAKRNPAKMAAKQRVYRERHTEFSRAVSSRYAAEHRSERAAYKADWQRKNAATVNARTSLWAKKNRQTTRAAGERYRAHSLNAAGAGVTGSDRKRLLSESFGLCAYCFLPAWRLELDHVDPISRGGMHDPENMVASCRRCNASKNNSTLLVWLAERQLRERILQGETVGAT